MDVKSIIEKHKRESRMVKIYFNLKSDKIDTTGDYNFLDVVEWCTDRWGPDGMDNSWRWDYDYNMRVGADRLIIIAHQDEVDLTEFKLTWL